MNNTYGNAAGASIGVSVFMLVLCIFFIICRWRIYAKAGKRGWACLVPIYSSYVYYDVIYGSGWKFLLCLIPVVGQIISIVAKFRLARCFNKGTGFGLGLLFLPYIFIPVLAFGSAEYYDTIESFI